LITKNETKSENKIPVLGDLPFFGALFRYRTQMRAKTELLVIMTPHIVYNKMDIERVLGEESRRMDWILSDVLRTHGTYGMDPVIPKKDPAGAAGNPNCAPGIAPNGEIEGPAPVPMLPQGAPTTVPPMGKMPGQPQAYMPSQSNEAVSTNGNRNGGGLSGYTPSGADNNWSNPAMAAPQGYPTQAQPQYQAQPQGYPMQAQPQGYQAQGQPQGYATQPQGYPAQGQPQGYPTQTQPQGYPSQPQTQADGSPSRWNVYARPQ
jgi:Bacterial type II and III secretion system protein